MPEIRTVERGRPYAAVEFQGKDAKGQQKGQFNLEMDGDERQFVYQHLLAGTFFMVEHLRGTKAGCFAADNTDL